MTQFSTSTVIFSIVTTESKRSYLFVRNINPNFHELFRFASSLLFWMLLLLLYVMAYGVYHLHRIIFRGFEGSVPLMLSFEILVESHWVCLNTLWVLEASTGNDDKDKLVKYYS